MRVLKTIFMECFKTKFTNLTCLHTLIGSITVHLARKLLKYFSTGVNNAALGKYMPTFTIKSCVRNFSINNYFQNYILI
jgi:hypothetical protein